MADVRILGFNIGTNFVARTGNQQNQAETTGTIANNKPEPVFRPQSAETTGAVAFEAQDSSAQAGQSFMAVA